jgi:flagellar basal-body rod protein FlgG
VDIRYLGLRESIETLLGQEQRLNQVSNNLANVDTPGYKKERVAFQEALITARNGYQRIGKTTVVKTDQQQAATQLTGNPLDMAITGDGYFKIQTAQGIRYSRAGNFQINGQGEMVTPHGDPVVGQSGTIIINGKQVTIAPNGAVNVDGQEVGQLDIVTFSDTSDLSKEGKNYFQRKEGGGQEIKASNFAVQQGFIEKSNVNSITEMTTMMELLRTYETQQRVIRTIDDIDDQAVSRVGKLTP